jgi:hypothetical protein
MKKAIYNIPKLARVSSIGCDEVGKVVSFCIGNSSTVMINGSTKEFEIFQRMRPKPDTLERTSSMFEFIKSRSKPRICRFKTNKFSLDWSVFFPE